VTRHSLANVALAISAFRSSDSVLSLLERVFSGRGPQFGSVIVVDSLGDGKIARILTEKGWPVRYENADVNLGSAGNLARRLELAAATDAAWCFTVNHDGEVDTDKVIALRSHGERSPRVGAVYPQLRFTRRGGTVDAPRKGFASVGAFSEESEAEADCLPVSWSSSNCALYRLQPTREGVKVWPDLWMGFEDLAYGWSLQTHGWEQLLCRSITVDDSYEYTPVTLLGRKTYIPEKPPWYAYYLTRNLVMIRDRTASEVIGTAGVVQRALREAAIVLLFRKQKAHRLKLLLQGYRDGAAGLKGKGLVP
jgi:GT2 family glycosyltransferase